MSRRSPTKLRARRLQEQTGWSYSECLRCVRTMSEDEIDDLIDRRAMAELEQQTKGTDPPSTEQPSRRRRRRVPPAD